MNSEYRHCSSERGKDLIYVRKSYCVLTYVYVVNITKSVLRLNLLLFVFAFTLSTCIPQKITQETLQFHEYMPVLWLKSGKASSRGHIASIFNSTLFCVNFTFHQLESDLAAFESITMDLSFLPSFNFTPGRMIRSGLTLEAFLVTQIC